MTMETKKHITLRERKHARTKLALLRAALERIKTRPLDDIAVKELTDEAMVSEPTFFNYFPKKIDLLIYYIQLWTIDVTWHARQLSEKKSAIAEIEAVFEYTARLTLQNPAIMAEIIAFHAKRRAMPTPAPLTLAEKTEAFPDIGNVEELPETGLVSILPPMIARAVRSGELPRSTDVDAVFMLLCSIFLGAPAILSAANAEKLPAEYKRQLRLLWAGLKKGGKS